MFKVIAMVDGVGSVSLGEFSQDDALYIFDQLSDLDVEVIYSDDLFRQDLKLVANPATNISKDISSSQKIKRAVEFSLKAVTTSQKAILYPEKATVGRPAHKKKLASSQMNKSNLEKISLEEAVANLVWFFPKVSQKFSETVRASFLKNRFISESDIVDFDKKDLKALDSAVLYLKENLLKSDNLKLRKTKVPVYLGIGEPTEDPLFNEVEVPVNFGLNLLPHGSLIKKNTLVDEDSYLDVIKNIQYPDSPSIPYFRADRKPKGVVEKKPHTFKVNVTEEAFDTFKTLTLDTLNPLAQKRNLTGCPNASKGCISVCNFSSGGRYNADVNLIGQPLLREDVAPFKILPEQKAGAYARMLAGQTHTAFMANPVYFIRILIECIKRSTSVYDLAICEANYERSMKDLPKIEDTAFQELLPTSVRLNMWSDYTWELICPDLFKIFNGKTSFNGKTNPYVQFYDYTKIPGRWSKDRRKSIGDVFGIIEYDQSYSMPSNYQTTFSFSGTTQSYLLSLIAMEFADQNATYVFASSLTSSGFFAQLKKLSDSIQDATTRSAIQKFKSFTQSIKSLFESVQGGEVKTTKGVEINPLPEELKLSLLPSGDEFFTFKVIPGDNYDYRYLDQYFQDNLYEGSDKGKGVIVGLTYKSPRNAKLSVGDDEYIEMNPLTAAVLSKNKGIADFVFFRLGVENKIEFEDLKQTVRFVITPTTSGADSLNRMIQELNSTDLEAFISNEVGDPAGQELSLETIEDLLNKYLENGRLEILKESY